MSWSCWICCGLAIAGLVAMGQAAFAAESWKLESPSGTVTVEVKLTAQAAPSGGEDAGTLRYRVERAGRAVLGWSPLGIVREDAGFERGLELVDEGAVTTRDEAYRLLHGKRLECRDHCRERTLTFSDGDGHKLQLVLRAYDDGVAFRYRFPETDESLHRVTREATGFQLPAGARIWAHPYDRATKYSPAYETYYLKDQPAGTASPHEEGWAFPLLFRAAEDGPWGLITEAGLDRSYCGSRLEPKAPDGLYRLRFPEPAEGNHTGAVEPSWTLPWATPWRVVIVGESAARIAESTLVTDVSPPSTVEDTSWIRPGRVSWSWLFDHDSPQDCDKLKEFVDLAAEMGWEYSLVDANWTIMKNGTIHDLIAYADARGVGLLLWYNSGGPHNFVSEKPRGLMDHREVRRGELALLKRWGIRGVKVDFFQSDKQSIIALYQDILEDAADAGIMVNFHGCTLPRGWSRTYPHLMSMESMRGEECYSFDRRFPEEAPSHNATLPFTRNVVGPMDYTPVMFQDNVYPKRTTHVHELALPIVFESAWLHFADGVAPYRALPEAPAEILKRIPVVWDETRCIVGDPGRVAVLARRSGHTWYVGGIHAGAEDLSLAVDSSFLGNGAYSALVIEDGPDGRSFRSRRETLRAGDPWKLTLRPYGGFVIRLAPSL